jgi:hypothetical protein
MKKKLELKYLAPYLPYRLKARFQETLNPKCRKYVIGTIGALYNDGSIVCFDTVNSSPDSFKPLLVPMDKLTAQYLETLNLDLPDEQYLLELRVKRIGYWNIPYKLMELLFEHHFDVFGLIEQELAEELK